MLQAVDGSFRVKLPAELRQKVAGNDIRTVNLGIRPIHVTARHTPSSNGMVELEGRVHTYENLGEEGQLAAHVGKREMLVVTPATEHFERGGTVWLQLHTQHVHLFNAETSIAL